MQHVAVAQHRCRPSSTALAAVSELTDNELTMTVSQVARYCQVSEQAVRASLARGSLQGVPGHSGARSGWRVPVSEVERYYKRRQQKRHPGAGPVPLPAALAVAGQPSRAIPQEAHGSGRARSSDQLPLIGTFHRGHSGTPGGTEPPGTAGATERSGTVLVGPGAYGGGGAGPWAPGPGDQAAVGPGLGRPGSQDESQDMAALLSAWASSLDLQRSLLDGLARGTMPLGHGASHALIGGHEHLLAATSVLLDLFRRR